MFMPLILVETSSAPSPNEAYAAIFNDAQHNAMIGNWNPLIDWPWVFGSDWKLPPTMRIDKLDCRPRGRSSRCTFTLTRIPAEGASEQDLALPRRLSCRADLELEQDDDGTWAWRVRHEPHPGHSRTTMQCKLAT